MFIYDLAAAGLQPSLELMAAEGPGCKCAPVAKRTPVTPAGFPHDLCNECYGKLHRHQFASAFQVLAHCSA